MLRWKIFRSRWTALAWLLLMTAAFFIPGSALPKENWFSKIYFDKWVHVGLFAGLVFLWRSAFDWKMPNYNSWLFLIVLFYGFLIELAQQKWVPYRSFDFYDVLADTAGIVLGFLIWFRVYKKNKPL